MGRVLQTTLQKAKEQKKDEFYTQLSDIENELKHYRDQFRDKVVFCNCDDPYESNFFKYFANNFNFLGLKSSLPRATLARLSPVGNYRWLISKDSNLTVNSPLWSRLLRFLITIMTALWT